MGLIRPLDITPLGAAPTRAADAAPPKIIARHGKQYDSGSPYKSPMPLYLSCSSLHSTESSTDYTPGRIIICSTGLVPTPEGEALDESQFRFDLADVVCEQDVLYASMYEGGMLSEGPYPLAPTVSFDANLEVLREVAPQVRAVLVGNRYAEMGYCSCIPNGETKYKEMSTHRICNAVREAGNMIRSVGGRPAFGLIDYQILLDCYWSPGQPLRAVLQDLDAIVISFLGFKFWPKMKTLYDHDRDERILPKSLLDGPPYHQLQEWLRGLEAWSGVDYMAGLMRQNAQRCFDNGFSAGVIGNLPDGSM